jgi:hypothetical protein
MSELIFSDIYKQIVEKIYPETKNNDCGIMYEALSIILADKQEHKNYICEKFAIELYSSLEEDVKISEHFLSDITSIVYIDRLLGIKFVNEKVSGTCVSISKIIDQVNPLSPQKENQMKLVITAVCLMVGAYACYQFLRRSNVKNAQSQKMINGFKSSLCLVVPASTVYELQEGQFINRDQILKLIDSATEFLCIEHDKAINAEVDVYEEPTPDSRLKFYIRIDLENAGNIIGKETQYGMKRELPSNVTGQITQLGFLKNVSILRSFNRI